PQLYFGTFSPFRRPQLRKSRPYTGRAAGTVSRGASRARTCVHSQLCSHKGGPPARALVGFFVVAPSSGLVFCTQPALAPAASVLPALPSPGPLSRAPPAPPRSRARVRGPVRASRPQSSAPAASSPGPAPGPAPAPPPPSARTPAGPRRVSASSAARASGARTPSPSETAVSFFVASSFVFVADRLGCGARMAWDVPQNTKSGGQTTQGSSRRPGLKRARVVSTTRSCQCTGVHILTKNRIYLYTPPLLLLLFCSYSWFCLCSLSGLDQCIVFVHRPFYYYSFCTSQPGQRGPCIFIDIISRWTFW
ncbi:uncharacterized protein V1510DRAFT_301374, partial [Dipodascopsis tothii]|uniref:uncharacterized protein n=1 Tax=Dipodascopsis tothii TaxID=44089 RepID=UPI0034CD931C